MMPVVVFASAPTLIRYNFSISYSRVIIISYCTSSFLTTKQTKNKIKWK